MSMEMSKSSRMRKTLNHFSSWVVLSLLLIVVVFSGCQNSDSQTKEIAEEVTPSGEISSEETLVQNTETPPAGEEAKNAVPKVSDSEEESVADDPSEAKPVKTDVAATPDAKVDSNSEEASSTNDDSSPESPVNSDADAASDIVSLQAEMDRKKREQLLGLNQETVLAEPREIKLLVKEKEFSKESKHDAWRVTFDDIDLLKILNMEPVPLNAEDYLPKWLTALQGQKIILRGWMFPPDQSDGIRRFMFVRDNQICCFGRKAKVYDKLWVKLQKGETSKYIQGRPFDLVGTFKIETWIEDERDEKTGEFVETLGLLYHIEDATIISK